MAAHDLFGVLFGDEFGHVALELVGGFDVVVHGELRQRQGGVELAAVELPDEDGGDDFVALGGCVAAEDAVHPCLILRQEVGFGGCFVFHAVDGFDGGFVGTQADEQLLVGG